MWGTETPHIVCFFSFLFQCHTISSASVRLWREEKKTQNCSRSKFLWIFLSFLTCSPYSTSSHVAVICLWNTTDGFFIFNYQVSDPENPDAEARPVVYPWFAGFGENFHFNLTFSWTSRQDSLDTFFSSFLFVFVLFCFFKQLQVCIAVEIMLCSGWMCVYIQCVYSVCVYTDVWVYIIWTMYIRFVYICIVQNVFCPKGGNFFFFFFYGKKRSGNYEAGVFGSTFLHRLNIRSLRRMMHHHYAATHLELAPIFSLTGAFCNSF